MVGGAVSDLLLDYVTCRFGRKLKNLTASGELLDEARRQHGRTDFPSNLYVFHWSRPRGTLIEEATDIVTFLRSVCLF